MLDKGENKDNGIGGYTIQNIITLGNDEKSRNKLNNMLYTPVIDGANSCEECLVKYECSQYRENCLVKEPLTVKEAIKTIADKTICHYDSYFKPGSIGWDYIHVIKKILYDEKEKVNIDFVMKTLVDILKDGVSVNFSSIDDALKD